MLLLGYVVRSHSSGESAEFWLVAENPFLLKCVQVDIIRLLFDQVLCEKSTKVLCSKQDSCRTGIYYLACCYKFLCLAVTSALSRHCMAVWRRWFLTGILHEKSISTKDRKPKDSSIILCGWIWKINSYSNTICSNFPRPQNRFCSCINSLYGSINSFWFALLIRKY